MKLTELVTLEELIVYLQRENRPDRMPSPVDVLGYGD